MRLRTTWPSVTRARDSHSDPSQDSRRVIPLCLDSSRRRTVTYACSAETNQYTTVRLKSSGRVVLAIKQAAVLQPPIDAKLLRLIRHLLHDGLEGKG